MTKFLGYYIEAYFKSRISITVSLTNKYVTFLKFLSINVEKLRWMMQNGNSIEILVVIIWKVSSPAKAYYNASNYCKFVFVQSNLMTRELVSNYLCAVKMTKNFCMKIANKISDELLSIL